MTHTTQCPLEALNAFAADGMRNELPAELIEHLDGCPECCRRLDALAADGQTWSTAVEAFTGLDPNSLSCTSPTRTNSGTDSGLEIPAGSQDITSILKLLAASDDPRAAGRIGAFEILGIVGSGGMGIVLKARDPALDRYVAIKLLAPHLASSSSARKRFAREARAAAAVIHENVIEIYQVAHWHDLPYLVMPYLPDPSLGQRISSEGPLDLESVLSVGLQLARGLSAAHSQGLVHRDVKPANILLSKGTERAIITDFGLARTTDDASLTRAGVLSGTPHYMSPEQAQGAALDQRSDLFSLGSVLFAMIMGRPPVDLELGSETIERIAAGRLPSLRSDSPNLPSWLIELVDWLHQYQPARRPESAGQVAELLEQCLAHVRQPDKTAVPSLLQPDRRSFGMNMRRSATLAATFVVIVLASLWMWSPPTPPESKKALEPIPDIVSSKVDRSLDEPTTEGEAMRIQSSALEHSPPTVTDGGERGGAQAASGELSWDDIEPTIETLRQKAIRLKQSAGATWQPE